MKLQVERASTPGRWLITLEADEKVLQLPEAPLNSYWMSCPDILLSNAYIHAQIDLDCVCTDVNLEPDATQKPDITWGRLACLIK